MGCVMKNKSTTKPESVDAQRFRGYFASFDEAFESLHTLKKVTRTLKGKSSRVYAAHFRDGGGLKIRTSKTRDYRLVHFYILLINWGEHEGQYAIAHTFGEKPDRFLKKDCLHLATISIDPA